MITYYPEFVEIVDEEAVGKSFQIKSKPKPKPKVKKPIEKAIPAKKPIEKKIEVKKLAEMSIRILAALVNPIGTDRGKETITLLNTTPEDVNLKGWAIEDKKGKRTIIDAVVKGGQTYLIDLKSGQTNLVNTGGTLVLFDHENDPMDIVSYSRNDASNEGWTIVF